MVSLGGFSYKKRFGFNHGHKPLFGLTPEGAARLTQFLEENGKMPTEDQVRSNPDWKYHVTISEGALRQFLREEAGIFSSELAKTPLKSILEFFGAAAC